MATRRIVQSERTILDQDDTAEEKSNTSPAVPKDVIFKLLGFTAAMVVIPIGSYFLTVHKVFNGNSSLAGGMAAVLANVVLITYIIVAVKEDQTDLKKGTKPESKKTQ
ncbi:vacuolar atpase assembly integral membrane vma21 [Trichoderma cornu-damae]|uniref:Vacuolar atpase assembly integral membrane vma21 n=1 Tax=Trichoderma cornu-damae TaxID=654480 RepID=A0A9P8QT88_9HYPO|nr:vacuolar atpase assembly integral membrane vma21 [Trichoderma cornu-damae]